MYWSDRIIIVVTLSRGQFVIAKSRNGNGLDFHLKLTTCSTLLYYDTINLEIIII